MKFAVLMFLLIFCGSASADSGLKKLARNVSSVDEIPSLVSRSFGGGKHHSVEGSDYYVVDLHHTSGVSSSEYFVFRRYGGERIHLLAMLPFKSGVLREASYKDGVLVVTVVGDGGQPVVELELFD